MGRQSRAKAGRNGGEEALLDTVAAIYDAALAPELWPRALSKVSKICGSSWTLCSITPLDPMTPGVTFQNAEADPEVIVKMLRFTTADNNPSVPRLLATPLGQMIRREEHFTDAEWERTEIHNDLYRPRGIYAAIGVPLIRSRYFVPFGVHRNRSHGGFEPSHLQALSYVIPHLQRAIDLALRLNCYATHARAVASAWDRLAFGLLVLDARGCLLWVNRAAERVLSRRDGLHGSIGTPLAAAHRVNARFQQLIGEAARTANEDGLCNGGAILIPRTPPATPLSLVVSPVRADVGGAIAMDASGTPAVLVFISDPDLEPKVPGSLLQQLYGLTERETRLASLLLDGRDLRDIGDRMNVSMHTVRTHLRNLFDKTQTRRQAELVRRLSASLSIFGEPGRR